MLCLLIALSKISFEFIFQFHQYLIFYAAIFKVAWVAFCIFALCIIIFYDIGQQFIDIGPVSYHIWSISSVRRKKNFFVIWPFPFKEWTSPPIHIEIQVTLHSALSPLNIYSKTPKFGYLHIFYSFSIRLPQILGNMPLLLVIDNFRQNRLTRPLPF